jgi:hypothetical protein
MIEEEVAVAPVTSCHQDVSWARINGSPRRLGQNLPCKPHQSTLAAVLLARKLVSEASPSFAVPV